MVDIVKAILAVLISKEEASIDDIAQKLDATRNEVINAIHILECLGLIDVKRSNNTVIRLNSDARKLLGL